tara:strand:+ start:247 stop:372 length:126 start_codon:yes stop_codon:yes gene_type:complete
MSRVVQVVVAEVVVLRLLLAQETPLARLHRKGRQVVLLLAI